MYLLVDTCFWYGLCNTSDSHHPAASAFFPKLKPHKVLLPWPVLYETMCEDFLFSSQRRPFYRALAQLNTEKVDDSNYRERACSVLLKLGVQREGPGLVDTVLHYMISDPGLKIHGVVTFDHNHFRGYCRKYRVQLLPEESTWR